MSSQYSVGPNGCFCRWERSHVADAHIRPHLPVVPKFAATLPICWCVRVTGAMHASCERGLVCVCMRAWAWLWSEHRVVHGHSKPFACKQTSGKTRLSSSFGLSPNSRSKLWMEQAIFSLHLCPSSFYFQGHLCHSYKQDYASPLVK